MHTWGRPLACRVKWLWKMQCLQKTKQDPLISLSELVGVSNLKSPAVWKMWLAQRQLPYGYFWIYLLFQYAYSCPLSCAFEHLSHGYQSRGWGHPRCHIHMWLGWLVAILVLHLPSWNCLEPGLYLQCSLLCLGSISLQFPLCLVPTILTGWTPSSSPEEPCWLAPLKLNPLPVLDPQAPGCSRKHGLQILASWAGSCCFLNS